MKHNTDQSFYPILLNLNKLPCLVVGGGKVAYRKVLSLLEFNAVVTVLAPKICKSLDDFAKQNKIKIIKKSYAKEFLKDYKIVFSATDNSKVNQMVRDDCTKENILLNVVDKPALCDFILPANIRRGDLTISISSQGKAPFYTKEMKRKLEQFISPVYTDVVNIAGEFRTQLLNYLKRNDKQISKKEAAKLKADIFKRFTSQDWEKILMGNGEKDSKFYVKKLLEENKLLK